jgi:hypothetical protein
MPVTPFRRGFLGRGALPLTPEQQMNSAALQQEKVNEVLAKQDARYDAMTDEEREKYYLKPSFMTKVKKALRGQ